MISLYEKITEITARLTYLKLNARYFSVPIAKL